MPTQPTVCAILVCSSKIEYYQVNQVPMVF